MALQQLAADLLLNLKKQQATDKLLETLGDTPPEQLSKELITDDQKKAFWINCYNAFFLRLRRDQGINKPAIYRERLCKIAGLALSLDEIEHGILRRFRAKLGLGFLPNLFASSEIKRLAVKHIDFRVHFALNCGAISCPPIAFYNAEHIEQQLEMATLSFLENETNYNPETNELSFSRLGLWYLGDFGGRAGIRRIVKQYLKTGLPSSQIVFRDYNWEENLDNFVEH